MNDILHRIGATASPEDTYAALATIDGLSRWWTEDTTGDPGPGGTIRFRFGGPMLETGTGRPAPNDLAISSWD